MTSSLTTRAAALTAAACLAVGLGACGSSDSAKGAASEGSSAVSSASSSAKDAASSSDQAAGSSSSSESSQSSSDSTSQSGSATSSDSASSDPSSATSTQSASSSAASESSSAGEVKPVKTAPAAKVSLAPLPDAAPTKVAAPVSHKEVTTTEGGAETGASIASQEFSHTVSGNTITWNYNVSGQQHLFAAMPEETIMAAPNSIGAVIDFGDGEVSGADLGAMTCMPKTALAPFNDKLTEQSHTYAKPGTYTVKVSTTICGDSGPSASTKTYQVTVK